jgi:hypothetical protein
MAKNPGPRLQEIGGRATASEFWEPNQVAILAKDSTDQYYKLKRRLKGAVISESRGKERSLSAGDQLPPRE